MCSAELGADIKKLGFGLMRLPRKGEGFDLELIKKMVEDAGLCACESIFLEVRASIPGKKSKSPQSCPCGRFIAERKSPRNLRAP